jgi:hypothetical protein
MNAPLAVVTETEDFFRERLRAHVFLVAVLPLLEIVVAERPDVRKLLRGLSGTVQFEARGADFASRLAFEGGSLRVSYGSPQPSTLHFVFRTLAAMNDFFAGKPKLPWISPYLGLFHPVMVMRVARLLMALRILEPPGKDAALPPPEERALRVRLLLYLVTRALERLHQRGFGPMRELAEGSPDRVYQWTVLGTDIGAWLRMRAGRVKCGRGTFATRRPFVHFVFPDVDAAFSVLTATGSQMQGFRGGRVVTYGSPEYTRKMALLMQDVDTLLVEG